jgi:coenzyme F420-0:L-glutamate ligase/coenzyme F420-1:gamma-L-glutamate ligase
MSGPADLRIVAVPDFPLVHAGTDLVGALLNCLGTSSLVLQDGDVVAFAQKVVSKAEGRQIDLAAVQPTPKALEVSAVVQKDPRLVELILRESRRIVRTAKDVLIVEHRLGFIMANAGIDQSNVSGSSESALLLPEDPDLWQLVQRASPRSWICAARRICSAAPCGSASSDMPMK